MESQTPGLSKKADQLSRPEEAPEDTGIVHGGLSVNLDEDEMLSGDSENADIIDSIPGGDLFS